MPPALIFIAGMAVGFIISGFLIFAVMNGSDDDDFYAS